MTVFISVCYVIEWLSDYIWISDILHALELLYVHIVYNFIDHSLFQWIVTMEQTPIVDHRC
mgnify:CR=1 FL=1